MTKPLPRSASDRTADAMLQAWECAFASDPAIYLSGPIRTGPRFVELLRAGADPETAGVAAFERNCAELRAAAARLRKERHQAVVEPASVDIQGWSRHDYEKLWRAFIERYASLVLFMPGWQYSLGCALEYLCALSKGVRAEDVGGGELTVGAALSLLRAARDDLLSASAGDPQSLKQLASELGGVMTRIEAYRRPKAEAGGDLRKDASLDMLARRMNVAQFVSFSPGPKGPRQEFARLRGYEPNFTFRDASGAVETLLRLGDSKSVNVRSYEPGNPQSHEFVSNLETLPEAMAALERLTANGLHTIVNETIDVHDGGVSGVLMGDVLEFAPDGTARCVEEPGAAASLPRGWGCGLLSAVYAFPVDFGMPLASRLEFSLHPRPRGLRRSNIIGWEYSEHPYVDAKPRLFWPNRFSEMLGDKAFGLLVAHHSGLLVPFTTVVNRRVAPFSFGTPTGSGETWIRTAPAEQTPGKFTTHQGWLDPFALLQSEDPSAMLIPSVLAQDGVFQRYSGALILGGDGELIIEGKAGEGESLMLGTTVPERLPSGIEGDLRAVYDRAAAALGAVRFEWVHDGERPWIVQLHRGATETTQEYITALAAERWQEFDVRAGLEALRRVVSELPADTGIALLGRVGLTSHFADVLRKAAVPARIDAARPD